MAKLLGVTRMDVRMAPSEVPTITLELAAEPGYNPNELYFFTLWEEYFPGNVILKCQYCGQWGAKATPCVHCGGAIV